VSVERRRTIALVGVALLVAGALGLYAAYDRPGGDDAVTVIEAEPAVASAEAPPPEQPAETPTAVAAEPQPAEEPLPAPEPERVVAALDATRTLPETVEEPRVEEPMAAEPSVEEPSVGEAVADDDPAVFDIVRVEPSGDAVIAGRARAGATVELLRNGEVHDIVVADATGAFAFVPPPLPPGAHEIALQVRDGDTTPQRSRESVTVVVDEGRAAAPIVALAAPDAPTRILSRPDPAPGPAPTAAESPAPVVEIAPEAAPAPLPDDAPPAAVAETSVEPEQTMVARADAAGPVVDRRSIRVATVEAETGGGLYVSGEGAPSASVRLYLNETFVGRASADPAGTISFAISRGVRPGVYRVRLDDIDPRDGAVLSRAEVEFEMPQALAEAAPEPAASAAAAPEGETELAEPETQVAAVAPGQEAQDAEAPSREAPSREAPVPAADAPAQAVDVAAADAVETEPAREATLTIPAVNTALVSRGDSLWRISRRVYGAGVRYTVIFDANQEQIRDPNLIFPGQIFVLPGEAALEDAAER